MYNIIVIDKNCMAREKCCKNFRDAIEFFINHIENDISIVLYGPSGRVLIRVDINGFIEIYSHEFSEDFIKRVYSAVSYYYSEV